MVQNELEIVLNQKGLKIVHIDARSVLNKIDEIGHNFEDFDVIVITETWLNDGICSSLLKLNDFELLRQDRDARRNKRGGGVCISIKLSIKFEVINMLPTLTSNDIEYLHVKIKPYMQKPVHIIGIYRPPEGKYKEFTQFIAKILNQIDKSRTDTVLLGDFNIDFNDKRLLSNSKLDTLESKYGLKQIIKENTRITNTSSTCIDLLFTDIQNITDSGTINYNISDHLPIFLIKKKARNKIIKRDVFGRSYLRYDREIFNSLLQLQDWTAFEVAGDPHILWDCFFGNLENTLNKICPLKVLKVVDNKPEWLTNDLLTRIRQRDKAYKKARRTKKQVD